MFLTLIFIQMFIFCAAEMICDLYQIWDLESTESQLIYTIAEYPVPSSRGKLIKANVLCPCDGMKNLCLRKCCLLHDTFTLDKKCLLSDFGDSKIDEIKNSINISNSPKIPIVYGSYCKSTIEPLSFSPLPPAMEYCVDYFSDVKSYLMMRCVPTEQVVINSIPIIYTICFALSIVFLLLTFIVYYFIQSLRNLPGKILLGYVVSLLTTYIFYFTLHVTSIVEGTFCTFSAYVMQFSFLASFFWLNVMCFDLWWTFSGYRAFNGLFKEKDRKKFIIYCLYAWGCPAVISMATFIIDNANIPYNIKPKLGRENNCWFGDNVALFCYFYSFISVLLSLNFLMFLHTTFIIIKHNKNEGKFLEKNGSMRHFSNYEKKRFYVYIKLSSIMGINWLMEVLSYFYRDDTIIWEIIDVCNTLQGFLIFLIFVCKRRVIILLNKKIYPKKMLFKDNFRSSSMHSNINNNCAAATHGTNLKLLKRESITTHSLELETSNDNEFVAV